ncbi:MAG: helix-turn-helix transcriptional regulator [Treponema sp.]|nr:helix-turn-helix transcriptional regulator [Treponema sp.]MBQ6566824.1 helix-turn-helix transcriptional regulator [Treponema sp.]
MSSFWEKVDEELSFRGIPRKELANKAGFPDSYISKGIARKSVPSADLALRIAHSLNVTLEYLLDMETAADGCSLPEKEKTLFHKYSPLINFLESSSEHDREVMEQLMNLLFSVR